jgi:hypothetical protein
MKHFFIVISSIFTLIFALNSAVFAFEPSNSEGLEAYIFLESQHAGGAAKAWATDCATCSRKAFSVTEDTIFKFLDDVIDHSTASLHSGKAGVIIYKLDSLEATQIVFFQ